MRLFRFILYVLFALGTISSGCHTKNNGGSSHEGVKNQVDRSGKNQGPWEIFEDSVLIAKGTYFNGKPDGLWTYWYPNGHIKEEGSYHKGIKNGIWIECYTDGDVMWKGEWENGTRHIGYAGAQAEFIFIGEVPEDNILTHDSTYHLRIRIVNIPAGNLFVETNSGSIARETDADLFTLNAPSSDTLITLAVGYIPDLEFKDFRNLVSEIDFKVR